MPLPLSVVIVARNEAAVLPRCLASVRGWVSECLVALNNTQDESAAAARAGGAVVHELPWQGFRDTKNAALALATQPWILCLDADEEVSLALRRDLTAFLGRADLAAWGGARFPRKVWFVNRWITHGDWYPDYGLRLIRAGQARWTGDAFVHERLECDAPVLTLAGDLHHYSFPTVASQVGKLIPFADLYVQQERAAGRRFSTTPAVTRPAWRFFRAYVLRRGFLDGFPGFYIAAATAFGGLVRRMRVYEDEHQLPPPPLNPGSDA